MTEQEKKTCSRLYLRRISYEDFLSEYPIAVTNSYLVDELKKLFESQDADALRYILLLASYHSYTLEMGKILHKLLLEGWHKEHEDIVRILQFSVCIPEAVDSLVYAMERKYDYLFEQDDYEPFVTKCMYAIAAIGTVYAREKIKMLAASSNETIKAAALFQLKRLS
ncbi:MAG: hypothetical protein DA408_21195 [Bacteroidetes bacterium]|nr:MAG: hypothetical protein C7N36_20120 [Bacteroidota bacterium]PTM08049.1 MAG: hypothetical protein DA408_21195 [Bacteroidota bacterium]